MDRDKIISLQSIFNTEFRFHPTIHFSYYTTSYTVWPNNLQSIGTLNRRRTRRAKVARSRELRLRLVRVTAEVIEDSFLAVLFIPHLKEYTPLIAPLLLLSKNCNLGGNFDPTIPVHYYKAATAYKFIFAKEEGYKVLRHYLDFWNTDPDFRKILRLPEEVPV